MLQDKELRFALCAMRPAAILHYSISPISLINFNPLFANFFVVLL
jgi:hypothetical protein